MYDEIINKRSKIENIIAQFDDVIGRDAKELSNNDKLSPADELRKELDDNAEEDRLLNIGIIGVVKAGKSSLLNSLFFNGENILPKAATPMTASLTVISYGDPPSATVEYFTPKEIENAKKVYDAYNAEWEEKHEKNKKEAVEQAKKRGETPDMEKVRRNTDRDMKEFPNLDLYEQYKLMQNVQKPSQGMKVLAGKPISELLEELKNYVGADGKMMPFTKSVEICLNQDELHDICVVDTPGMDDPVESRVARTEKYLSNCDVVFIISQAGYFFTSYEEKLIGLLFGREKKGNIFVVASQFDSALCDASVPKYANGELPKAIEKIKAEIFPKAQKAFTELKEEYKQVSKILSQPSDARADLVENNLNGIDQFEKISKGEEDCFYWVSSHCNDILLRYNDKGYSWDGDLKDSALNKSWAQLKEYYPDYFNSEKTGKANLEKLSGIKALKDKIDSLRKDKVRIITDTQRNRENAEKEKNDNFSRELTDKIKEKIKTIKNADLTDIIKQRKEVENILAERAQAVDETYEKCVDDFKLKIKEEILIKIKDAFATAENNAAGAEKSRTATGVNYSGPCCYEKAESYTYEVRTLNTSIVKSTLNNLVLGSQELLENSVENAKNEFKENILSKIEKALRDEAQGEAPEKKILTLLRASLRQIINNIELPDLDLGSNRFNSSVKGTVEDEEIDSFMDEVRNYTSSLRHVVEKARKDILSHIDKHTKVKISELISSDLKERIDELTVDIKEKELTIERLEKCMDALKKLI